MSSPYGPLALAFPSPIPTLRFRIFKNVIAYSNDIWPFPCGSATSSSEIPPIKKAGVPSFAPCGLLLRGKPFSRTARQKVLAVRVSRIGPHPYAVAAR